MPVTSVQFPPAGAINLQSGLAGHWSFEAGAELVDDTGRNPLSVDGTLVTTVGRVGQAVQSIAETILVRPAAALTAWPTGSVTVAGWVRRDGAGDLLIAGHELCGIYVVGARAWFLYGTADVAADSFGDIPIDTWVLVVGWFNQATGEIGVSVNGVADTATVSYDPDALAGDFYVCFADGTVGAVDQVAVWSRALSEPERAALEPGLRYGQVPGRQWRAYRGSANASDPADWYRVYATDRVRVCLVGVSTPRFLGSGANNTNLMTAKLVTIQVAAEAEVAIAIRRLMLLTDVTIAQTSVLGQFKVYRTSNASGGSVVSPGLFDTEGVESGAVTVRCTSSADGGSPLTGGSALSFTEEDFLWQQFSHRLHTAVNEFRSESNSLLPALVAQTPLILGPGEGIGLQYEGPNNGWRSTSHGIVNIVYEEFARP